MDQLISGNSNNVTYKVRPFLSSLQDERVRFARMTAAELAQEKEETLAKRVPTLDVDAITSEDSMREIATELHNKILKAFGALFDLQEKEKRQKYDVSVCCPYLGASPGNQWSGHEIERHEFDESEQNQYSYFL